MNKPSRLLPSVVLKTPVHKRILHFLGFDTGRDSNMPNAHAIGLELCDHVYDTISRQMWDAARLAEQVEVNVLGPIMNGADPARTFRNAAELLGVDRCKAGEALRTWSGCISGAKCIALGTRNGRNWPWWRRRQAKRMEMLCFRDPKFQVGVMAAVAFKVGRNEAYSFLGVPKDHFLRMGELAVAGSREPFEKPNLNPPATVPHPEAN